MSNTSSAKAITLVMENMIEVIRTSAVRGVTSTRKQHTLVAVDENNQPVHYLVNTEPFRSELHSDDESLIDPSKVEEAVAGAIFESAMEGKTFRDVVKLPGSSMT